MNDSSRVLVVVAVDCSLRGVGFVAPGIGGGEEMVVALYLLLSDDVLHDVLYLREGIVGMVAVVPIDVDEDKLGRTIVSGVRHPAFLMEE